MGGFYRVLVTPDGGEPYRLMIGYRDALAWERTSKKTATQFMLEQSAADTYRLAHLAARRKGMFTGELTEFEQTCEVEPGWPKSDKYADDEDEQPATPTSGAVSTGQ